MKSSEIWQAANENLVFVGVLFTWLQDDPGSPFVKEIGRASCRERV